MLYNDKVINQINLIETELGNSINMINTKIQILDRLHQIGSIGDRYYEEQLFSLMDDIDRINSKTIEAERNIIEESSKED